MNTSRSSVRKGLGFRLGTAVSLVVVTSLLLAGVSSVLAQPTLPAWFATSKAKLAGELATQYGAAQRPEIERGLEQVGSFWRAEDGDAAAFEDFVRTNYAGEPAVRDSVFARYERLLEKLEGHMVEIGREFRNQSDLDLGPVLPFDEIFAAYSPSAHITDDFFANRLAFVVLLNFPLTTLDERVTGGEKWTRRQWAETRLAHRFAKRIPAEVNLEIARATSAGESYIAGYNIWMHHLVDDKGGRLFPPKLRLLTHWNLRDEIKASYGDAKQGLAKQHAIQKVMERIVTQTIPQAVIDNPRIDWNPWTNAVRAAAVQDAPADASGAQPGAPGGGSVTGAPEPDTRYLRLLDEFRAERQADPYSPTAPTFIVRSFEESRELPEDRVRAMFEQVLTSPLVPQVAKLVEERLGRPLEPFDIWYNGFKERGAYTEEQLDAACRKKYPTAAAFEQDIPRILVALGFAPEKARWLAGNIVVDPSRGSGHALGASMRTAKAHLRTRVGKDGMDYKGYNIAVHELGHNVEQVFSLQAVDHTLLAGVPNNAFTEALAYVFQGRDLELLGLTSLGARSQALHTLQEFWASYEIGAVSLVDTEVWHWMYAHPAATPTELKQATIDISQRVWNQYFAPVFGKRDVLLLGIYSHMISYPMYLPDYFLGHLIAFQIESQMKKAGTIGPEFERMATCGDISPDIWMQQATGAPVAVDALLGATERALAEMK